MGAFLGLVPAIDRSGDKRSQRRVSEGDGGRGGSWWAALTTSWVLLARTGPQTPQKIASRGGKNAKKRAAVAVARKLCVLLHRLWVSAEVYDPLYNTHRRQQRREEAAETLGVSYPLRI